MALKIRNLYVKWQRKDAFVSKERTNQTQVTWSTATTGLGDWFVQITGKEPKLMLLVDSLDIKEVEPLNLLILKDGPKLVIIAKVTVQEKIGLTIFIAKGKRTG